MTSFADIEHEAYHVLRSFRRDAQREVNRRRRSITYVQPNGSVFSDVSNATIRYILENTKFLNDAFPEDDNK